MKPLPLGEMVRSFRLGTNSREIDRAVNTKIWSLVKTPWASGKDTKPSIKATYISEAA